MINFNQRYGVDRDIKQVSHIYQNIPSGYLRISITDTCNMKCSYCHNEGQVGVQKIYMSKKQLKYIVESALNYGLKKVRLTGGEPLLHADCHEMLEMLKNDFNIPSVGLNSNGINKKN